MNFSFLDISVKSPQDLNSWNRIKVRFYWNGTVFGDWH